jgi:hypothetical protein
MAKIGGQSPNRLKPSIAGCGIVYLGNGISHIYLLLAPSPPVLQVCLANMAGHAMDLTQSTNPRVSVAISFRRTMSNTSSHVARRAMLQFDITFEHISHGNLQSSTGVTAHALPNAPKVAGCGQRNHSHNQTLIKPPPGLSVDK